MLGLIDRLLVVVGVRADQRSRRARARRRLGLDLDNAAGAHRIHEASRGGSTYPQEAEMMDDAAQATQEPEETTHEAEAEQPLAAPEIPTIIVHYLGFTIDRGKLPTGHFPTKAKLVEAMDAAVLNKGWNIGSPDLDRKLLPDEGCYREKAKAIAAATRSAKAAAPCKLVILDSDGEEVESRTFRQKSDD